MKIKDWCLSVRDDYRARRRGEIRVLPRGSRGRVFEDRVVHKARARIAKLTTRAKITRADGTIEDLGIISQKDFR